MTILSKETVDHFMNGVQEAITDLFSLQDPQTGDVIRFQLKRNQRTYLYFKGPRGELYCYTPHPDTHGNFWCWTYQPTGKGSRSGNPTHWQFKELVRCAKRKTAKSKALRRLESAKEKVN